MSKKRTLIAIGAALVALAVFALGMSAFVYRDELRLLSMRPTGNAASPPTPDYSQPASWARWAATEQDATVDIFYIHPTTFYSRMNWNAPIDDEPARDVLEDHILSASIPLNEGLSANVYAPRYRQATFHATQRATEPGLEALNLAYQDIERAFRAFLIVRDPKTPIVLIGEEQGALHAATLLEVFFSGEDNALRKKLGVAYLTDWPISSLLPEIVGTPPCNETVAYRCLISRYNPNDSEWSAVDQVPIDFIEGSYVFASAHTPALVAPGQLNVNARVDALLAALEEEANYLAPIEDEVELGQSPINKVPD